MQWLKRVVLASALTGAAAFSVAAAPITYQEELTASGTLGGQSFSNADVVITQVSDTANVTNGGGGFFFNHGGTTTILIPGLGTATFTDETGAFVNFGSFGGFSGDTLNFPNNSSLVIVEDGPDAGFANYHLTTALPPVGPDSVICNCNVDGEHTSAGNLIFSSVSHGVFSATGGLASVPEPGSALSLAAGLFGLGLLRRRRAAEITAPAPRL